MVSLTRNLAVIRINVMRSLRLVNIVSMIGYPSWFGLTTCHILDTCGDIYG